MAAKPRKKKRVQRKKAAQIELHPDGWERFEQGLKQIATKQRSPKAKPVTKD
jgi:hypothetical protein